MQRYLIATSLVLSIAAASGGCNRGGEKMETRSEAQTQSAQPANLPATVQGCLKAGDAADTFVLTTARTEGSSDTATYQLVGDRTEDLRGHIGHRIEVTGMVQAQQESASRTVARPEDERPTGTSGSATVQTRSEVDIKRLSVTSVKPLDDTCER